MILLFAALLIATSCTLMFWLLHPFSRTTRATYTAIHVVPDEKPETIVRLNSATRAGALPSVPLHQRYLDRTRVLIQR
jgi:hypothetical protein